MGWLLFYLFLALGVSFLCSLLEAVMLSVTHGYIESLRRKKKHSGEILNGMKEQINRPLAAILTLNTVANTMGAAGVGAQVLHLYVQWRPGEKGGWVVATSAAVLTFLILVLSEIIPKTLGAVYWKKLAPTLSYVIRFLVYNPVMYPLVLALEWLSKSISGKRNQWKVSREEMMAVAEIGQSEGSLLTQETRVIHNLLRLNNVLVRDVLTPRSVLQALDREMTVREAVEKNSPIRFSRMPIFGKDLDDISGVVHRYKLLQAYSEGKGGLKLKELGTELHAVPEAKSVASVLDDFIHRREHIFLVVDEYGGTAGIITLEDAIETLLGVEIMDEFDTVEDMRKLAHQIGESRRRSFRDQHQ
ncbi:MAG: HlyC/CorC family transporter [Sedimentisphaerales bacterium]|nr:HlyC/CorC family transporter [Sedimentisphaerales bacterium]